MKCYEEQIRKYLEFQETNYGSPDIHSLLEMLCRCYLELNPVSGESIREGLGELRRVLEKLPPEEGDALFAAICHLCGETERHAFREGLHLGLRLFAEISESE